MERKVSARVRTQRWFVRYPRAVPIAVFLLTLAITMLSVRTIEHVEAESALTQTKEVANLLSSALQRRADAHNAYLRAGATLLGAQGAVTQTRFREYAEQVVDDESVRGAEGIAWTQRVSRPEVPAFEARIGKETGQPYSVIPAPAASTALLQPVTYIHPANLLNTRAIGYDMYSEPIRRAAMQEAMREAQPTASGALHLLPDGNGTASLGFIVYMPVYEGGRPHARLKGFIYSPFNALTFLSSALGIEAVRGHAVHLYDGSVAPGNLLAQQSTGNPSGAAYSVPLTIAHRRMVLLVQAPDAPVLSGRSLLTLIFGVMVAGLLFTLARLAAQQAQEDREALSWLEAQISIRNSLTRELNHRVKNTLANVLSIIALTRRRATDVDSFAESLVGRIRALSATHDLLTTSDWGATPIRAVIEAELSPYARDNQQEVDLDGPDVELAPNDALTLGLAIHELATNAAKYGALSVPSGRVHVRWNRMGEELVRVDWAEHGGPPVPTDRRRGFGTELIERVVSHELKHPVQLRFDPQGVCCEMVLPVRAPAAFRSRAMRHSR